MPLLCADQRSAGWYSVRKGRITASVAAGCLGVHPHMSRQEAWRRCLGIEKDSSNDRTRWGEQYEQTAKEAYEVETGRFIEPTGFWVSRVYDWLGASPDGFVGNDGLYEGKAPGKLPESVPIYHRIQMIVQMIVCERAWCDYFVWTPERDEPDTGWIDDSPTGTFMARTGEKKPNTFLRRVHLAGAAGIIRKLEAFYRTYVLTETEPPRKKAKRRRKVGFKGDLP